MTRLVALFRGINVGKAKRIAMADLRKLLESLGYTEVRTLLNSGNAVFEGPAGAPARHAERIRSAVAKQLGVDSLVIVKTAKDMRAVVDGNKLASGNKDPSKLLVAFAVDSRRLSAIASLSRNDRGADELHVGKHAAYLWCRKGILESGLAAALLRELEGRGTTRNWATTQKLDAMLRQQGT